MSLRAVPGRVRGAISYDTTITNISGRNAESHSTQKDLQGCRQTETEWKLSRKQNRLDANAPIPSGSLGRASLDESVNHSICQLFLTENRSSYSRNREFSTKTRMNELIAAIFFASRNGLSAAWV